jgi:hypothetical protein
MTHLKRRLHNGIADAWRYAHGGGAYNNCSQCLINAHFVLAFLLPGLTVLLSLEEVVMILVVVAKTGCHNM